ncbi:MAG: immunoglobulin domain-containing protein [Verrucomicrobia bacterium]|nr:immunoglobulin domain-containing protein [Verrucomicrobiota bacterium]
MFRSIRFGWLLLLLGFLGPGGASQAATAGLTDMFAARQVVVTDSGQALGSNVGATLEPSEPTHGGKPGGHSVWLSWTAPADGVLTVDTTGSDFDTLLGAYVLQPGGGPPLGRLHEVGRNDNNGSALTSLVQFGVTAGTNYEFAVDGYFGATGNITLNWNLLRSSSPPPILLSVPNDQSLTVGSTLILSVAIQATGPVKLSWFFNDVELDNEENNTLIIANFQPQNVGEYKLRIDANNIRFYTDAVEIEINSEGLTATLARDRLFDSLGSGLQGDDGLGTSTSSLITPRSRHIVLQAAAQPIGVTRGLNGTQIFNTSFATSDPGEPAHCGISGGASYWFAYIPPSGGTLALNTDGSSMDTVLAVYTYDPPLLGYQSLIPITCDNNSGANSLTSKLQFTADPTRTYLVVVDGVGGARGIAYLNYSFTAQQPVVPPTITTPPVDQTVNLNASASFAVSASGSAPLSYQWLHNAAPLTGATNATLNLPNVTAADAGSYTVTVSNSAGAATSAPATLVVLVPPAITAGPTNLAVNLNASASFAVSASGSAPLSYQWLHNAAPLTGATNATLSLPNVTAADAGSYAVTVSNSAGAATSAPATLTIFGNLAVKQDPDSKVVTIELPLTGQGNFDIEFTDQLNPPTWTTWPGSLTVSSGIASFTIVPQPNEIHFFRAHFR